MCGGLASVTTDTVNSIVAVVRDWNVLAIDDLESPPVEAAWRRFREEDGRGRLERVVMASGEHYAHAQVGGVGTGFCGAYALRQGSGGARLRYDSERNSRSLVPGLRALL